MYCLHGSGSRVFTFSSTSSGVAPVKLIARSTYVYRFRVCSIVKNFHLFGVSVSVDQLIIGLMIPRSIAPIEHRYSVLLLVMFALC